MTTSENLPLNDVDFGALARELRRARGLTQERLAREMDVTFGTVNGWENGRHEPIPALGRKLIEFARAAGIAALPRKPARPAAPQRHAGAASAGRSSRR